MSRFVARLLTKRHRRMLVFRGFGIELIGAGRNGVVVAGFLALVAIVGLLLQMLPRIP